MANQTGIAITIKAFLPTGKTLDEVFAALSIVKEAHATGDYSALLKAAAVEDVKTEQKTRRTEDAPQEPVTTEGNSQDTGTADATGSSEGPFVSSGTVEPSISTNSSPDESGRMSDADASALKDAFDNIPDDEAVPEFVKKGRTKAA